MEDTFEPYSDEFLIKRIYAEMKENNTLIIRKRLTIPVKYAIRRKDKKTYVTQYIDLCNALNRDPDVVSQFIGHELSTKTSINEAQELKITGFHTDNRINELIVSYILKFVQCSNCSSPDTEVVNIMKSKQLQCHKCKSLTLIE
jgi:translation initiation factor 2 subunit 2